MSHVRISLIVGSLLFASACAARPVPAQLVERLAAPTSAKLAMDAALPDSPGAIASTPGDVAVSSSDTMAFPWDQQTASPAGAQSGGVTVYAARLSTKIPAGAIAQPLTAKDKFEISIRRQLTLRTLALALVSSGYSHLLDNRPHYGTDSGGYGERLGASALRSTTQSFFYFGLYSSLFHDDPRYYVLGSQHTPKKRVLYAATRVIFTRKDDGSRAVNYPFLAAVASSAALTNAYYPERDRSVGRSVGGVFTTIGLNAGIMQLNEFGGDIRRRLFHKHQTTP